MSGVIGIGMVSAMLSAGGFMSLDYGLTMPGVQGETVYEAATDTYALAGTGYDIWNYGDSGGRLMIRQVAGDCEVMAAVERPAAAELANWGRAGLVLFPEITHRSMNAVFMRMKEAAAGTEATGAAQRMTVDVRASRGGPTSRKWEAVGNDAYADAFLGMRIVRHGDELIYYYTNATTQAWTLVYRGSDVKLGETVNAGVGVCRHRDSLPAMPLFTNRFQNVVVRELVTARALSNTSIAVSWVTDLAEAPAGPGVTYRVERAASRAGTFAMVADGVEGDTWTDAGLTAGGTYCYRVYAVPAAGDAVLVGTGATVGLLYQESVAPAGTQAGVHVEVFSPVDAKKPVVAVVAGAVSNNWEGAVGVSPGSMRLVASTLIVPEVSDYYHFVVDSGYAAWVWIDGVQVIEAPYATAGGGERYFHMTSASAAAAPLWLNAGRAYEVRVEYRHENAGYSPKCVLRWARQGAAEPEVLDAAAVGTALPQPWRTVAVGAERPAGGAHYDPEAHCFTVSGAGNDIWDVTDAFRFVYQEAKGDFELIARVVSQSGANVWRKAGLMVRSGTSANAAYYAALQSPANDSNANARWLVTQRRPKSGNVTSNFDSRSTPQEGFPRVPDNAYYWLRLIRNKGVLKTYAKQSAEAPWLLFETRTDVDLADTVYVGFAVTSHQVDALGEAKFDNVALLLQPEGSLTVTRREDGGSRVAVAAEGTTDWQIRAQASSPQMSALWTNAWGAGASFKLYGSSSLLTDSELLTGLTAAQALDSAVDVDWTPGPHDITYYWLDACYDTGPVSDPVDEHRPWVQMLPVCAQAPESDSPEPSPAGTGLYFEYTQNANAGTWHANVPPHSAQVDNVSRKLDNNASGLLATGLEASYYCITMTGWWVPPMTGACRLEFVVDDGYEVAVNGRKVAYRRSYAAAATLSELFDVKAGEPMAIMVTLWQGTGGANFQMRYRYENLTDWAFLPVARQLPLTAFSLEESAAWTAGSGRLPWESETITADEDKQGHIAVNESGTAVKLTGPGSGIGGTEDGFHYLRKSLAGNDFELTARLTAQNGSELGAAAGLMVRGSAAADAPNVALLRKADTEQLVLQARDVAAGGTQTLVTVEPPDGPAELRLAYKRSSRKVDAYVNGEWIGAHTLGATEESAVLGGLAVTSGDAAYYADALFEDMELEIHYPKGSVMLVR